MCLVTTTIGFFLGGHGLHAPLVFCFTLLGTALAAGGAGMLNNYLERDIDARMERTRHRPLPAGAVEPGLVLGVGVMLILGGVTVRVLAVNLLSAFIVLLTAFLYVVVYTPLKRLTWMNTPIGAIPGALPPVSGWAAATGELELGAWLLFAILFAWQHPHFYAIAWMFRDDYARAGFKMLSVVDPSGRRAFRQSIGYAVVLLAVTVGLWAARILGPVYLVGSVLLGVYMIWQCMGMARSGSLPAARRVLLASVAYLPALLVLIVVDFFLLRPGF
jgi:protoheme IX farnesyltransferase